MFGEKELLLNWYELDNAIHLHKYIEIVKKWERYGGPKEMMKSYIKMLDDVTDTYYKLYRTCKLLFICRLERMDNDYKILYNKCINFDSKYRLTVTYTENGIRKQYHSISFNFMTKHSDNKIQKCIEQYNSLISIIQNYCSTKCFGNNVDNVRLNYICPTCYESR